MKKLPDGKELSLSRLKIPDGAGIRSIDLRVKDLDGQLKFYSEQLGLKVTSRTDRSVFLSTGSSSHYVIGLFEDKNALPPSAGSPGLFHAAIRFPGRKSLARTFLKLYENKTEFQGFSDHIVSEAIYLSDPEGNGIELYSDRPRDSWKWIGDEVMMATEPLDLQNLMNELTPGDILGGIEPAIGIGHIHLRVSNLSKAEKFYKDVLGFGITNHSYPGAMFFSAGGYHHHIGTNTWSVRGSSVPSGALGLISFTINVPDVSYLEAVKRTSDELGLLESGEGDNEIMLRDFDNNRIRLTLR